MLPGLSGEEVLPEIKGIPVIVISAKAEVSDKVELLLGGAADYVTKPFDIQELLARIEVQFRNRSCTEASSVLKWEELSMDLSAHSVSVKECGVRLTKTEFAILKLLMKNPSQVIPSL